MLKMKQDRNYKTVNILEKKYVNMSELPCVDFITGRRMDSRK